MEKSINWDNLECQEASMFSTTMYIPCGRKPVVALIWHNKDRKAYPMCDMCADHNIRNRGGIELARRDVPKKEIIIDYKTFNYSSECHFLRLSLINFIKKYFEINLTEEEIKNPTNNETIIKMLQMLLSGDFYKIKIEEGEKES